MSGLLHAGQWSITRRLSVYFALSSLVLMSSVGIYLSKALDNQLVQEHLVFLGNDIAAIRARLANANGDFSGGAQSGLKQLITPVGSRLRIAIFDAGKNILLPGPWLDMPHSALPEAAPVGQPVTASVMWLSAEGQHFRVISAWAKLGPGDGRGVMIALALDVTLEQRLLAGYRNTILLTLLVAVLAAAIIGYLVSRQGLQPIRRIAMVANEITSSQLDRRLGFSDSPIELHELIHAFNRMLDRLRDSFDRLSQFSSDIAHELRTPINNLMGETQVALSRPRSAEDYRGVLESAVEEFERLSRMIESMLFLARADGAESVIAPAPLDARQELEKVAEFYQLVADESSVRIECHGQSAVWADPQLLRRAINNLVSNALRYTRNGQVIRLEAHSHADGATTISVMNPGVGISAAHLPRIFDRFYRADVAREHTSEGAGLGLSIVRMIMQLHGGTVTVSSEVDELTIFSIWFPRHRQDAKA